jgi:ribosome-binding protein aMBF1 (putative translation factor)
MKRITKERQKRNLTKTELGFELRIHPARIGKIESGKAEPYEPSKKKLEDFFGMNMDILLEEAE